MLMEQYAKAKCNVLLGLLFVALALSVSSARADDSCHPLREANLRIEVGHSKLINAVAISQDHRLVLTGSWDNSARLWELATGREICRFEGHGGGITSAAFSPDGQFVATASQDHTARLWSVNSGEMIRIIGVHQSPINSIEFSSDGKFVVTASGFIPPDTDIDNSARIWGVASGQQVQMLVGHSSSLTKAFFSRDGTRVISTSLDGSVRVWNSATGTEIKRFGDSTRSIVDARLSSDGKVILIASNSKVVNAGVAQAGDTSGPSTRFSAQLWDITTGREIQQYLGHTAALTAVALSGDGSRVASASQDGTVRLWGAASGKEERRLSDGSQSNQYRALIFSDDGEFVLAGGEDNRARMWNYQTGNLVARYTGLAAQALSIASSADGHSIATGNGDGTARIWDTETGQQARVLGRHQGEVFTVSFSRDSHILLIGGGQYSRGSGLTPSAFAEMWDVNSGGLVRSLPGHGGVVTAAAFSPDSRLIATASEDAVTRVFDAYSGGKVQEFNDGQKGVQAVAFSPDGLSVVTGSSDNSVRLWDIASGHMRWRSVGPDRVRNGIGEGVFLPRANAIAFARDGSQIFVGDDLGTIRVLNVDSGTTIKGFSSKTRINSLALSEDNRYLLAGEGAGTVELLDARNGSKVSVFEGHTDAVRSAAFRGDNVLSASEDGTARVWRLDTASQLAILVSFIDGRSAVVTGDGRFDMPDGGSF